MYKIEFKFEPRQKVLTPTNLIGCILSCGVGIDGIFYRVQAGQVIENYSEAMLSPCPQHLAQTYETKKQGVDYYA